MIAIGTHRLHVYLQDPREVPRKQGYVLHHKECHKGYLSDRNQPWRKRINCRLRRILACDEHEGPFFHEEQDAIRKSKESCTTNTANGSTTAREEAAVNVTDFAMLIAVQLLEDSPVVLSLGKLCEEKTYSDEWKEGQSPTLTSDGKITNCKSDNCVPRVDLGVTVERSPPSAAGAASEDRAATASGDDESKIFLTGFNQSRKDW